MGKIIIRSKVEKESPYEIPGLNQKVYSLEELVYTYYQNLYRLEESVMDRRLPSWLDRQGKRELAEELIRQIDAAEGSGDLEIFIGTVLEGISYYTPEEIRQAKEQLARWSHADPNIRQKEKWDYSLAEGRIQEAINGYENLVEKLSMTGHNTLLAALYHNLGVAYGRMFVFDKAAEMFAEAFQLSGDRDSKELYMLSLRMYHSKESYVNLIASEKLGEEAAVALEEKLLAVLQRESESENRMYFENIKRQKQLGNQEMYATAMQEFIRDFKNEWRNGYGDF